MKLWLVEGYDELDGTIFAFCSSEEKAKMAKQKLASIGWEDCIQVKQSNLELDKIIINNRVISM